MTLRTVSPPQALNALLAGLGFHSAAHSTGGPVPLTVYAEMLRCALWALSEVRTAEGATMPTRVHILRLYHSVPRLDEIRELLASAGKDTATRPSAGAAATDAGLGGEGLGAHILPTLNELRDIGDVAELPNGYWLPAPLRCVSLPQIERWLLVGGCPSHLLPRVAQEALFCNGAARLLTRRPMDVLLHVPMQSIEAWSQSPIERLSEQPTEPLSVWAGRLLPQVTLTIGETEPGFQYYAPNAPKVTKTGTPQFHRWTTYLNLLPDGRYLSRLERSFSPTRFAVTSVRAGQITGRGGIDPTEVEIRRLCYGLDALAKTPVTITVEAAGSRAILTLRSELPRAETRLLAALGQLQLPPDGRYYPRRWILPRPHIGEIAAALKRLGVQVEARQ